MENNTTFNYSYSAKDQAEIKAIREKYVDKKKPEDKMTTLRKLDALPTQKATIVSLIVGITGALILGFGMSLIMTDLRELLAISAGNSMIIGLIVGVIGIIFASIAYPLFNLIVKKERKKIAPEIFRLTDELIK